MSCNCQQNTCCQGQYGNFDNNGYANYFNSNIGNGFTPQPIIAPKKVCTTFQNQYVEQPIICPIECRRVITLFMFHVITLAMNKHVIHKQIVTKNRCLASIFL